MSAWLTIGPSIDGANCVALEVIIYTRWTLVFIALHSLHSNQIVYCVFEIDIFHKHSKECIGFMVSGNHKADRYYQHCEFCGSLFSTVFEIDTFYKHSEECIGFMVSGNHKADTYYQHCELCGSLFSNVFQLLILSFLHACRKDKIKATLRSRRLSVRIS